MLQEARLDLSELGELAEIIPGREPELQLTIPRIPVTQPSLGTKIIPVCEPTLGGNEKKYVLDCLETKWISSAGKYIPLFEEMFAAQCGTRYAVACSNGTVALHLALAALGIGAGDEVIVPTFTMIASINAVNYTGARAVLIDSEMDTWNMDVSQLEAKITPRTRAIMVMHTYGHPVDMDAVLAVADRHGLYVVEDAAEAHGAEYKGQRVGGLGIAGCFSFYANKIITTGEGGMLTTNDERLAKIAANLRDHAFSEERHFWHKYLGFNYRMTNLQAAVGLAQTERFDEFVQARRQHAAWYNEQLQGTPGLTLPPEAPWARNVFWMYSILVDEAEFGLDRDELRRRLAKRGIETRTFFIPLHLQPIYYQQYRGQHYPVAEDLCRRGLYLPSASSLTRDEVEFVANSLLDCRRD